MLMAHLWAQFGRLRCCAAAARGAFRLASGQLQPQCVHERAQGVQPACQGPVNGSRGSFGSVLPAEAQLLRGWQWPVKHAADQVCLSLSLHTASRKVNVLSP